MLLGIVKGQIKRRREFKFYKSLIPQHSLCFDMGANKGDRTQTLLDLGNRVIAIEPQSKLFEDLKNRFSNVSTLQVARYAVGARAGIGELFICDEYDECSTMSNEFMNTYAGYSKLHWNKSESVSIVTLDELITTYGLPYYCKLDIEGGEFEALQGLHQAIPLISLEFNLPLIHQSVSCLELLSQQYQYSLNYIGYENFTFINKDWIPATEFHLILDAIKTQQMLTGELFLKQIDFNV